MGSSDKFCLRWNDFESNISLAFRELRDDSDFFDVTLASEDDRQVRAHKVILSACSPFFRKVLKRNPHNCPLLYLKGVRYSDLISILDFMYHGEVNVAQDELNSFLAVAEELSVKGLTTNGSAEEKEPCRQKQSGIIAATSAPKQQPGRARSAVGTGSATKPAKRPRLSRLPPQTKDEWEEGECKSVAIKTEPSVGVGPPDEQEVDDNSSFAEQDNVDDEQGFDDDNDDFSEPGREEHPDKSPSKSDGTKALTFKRSRLRRHAGAPIPYEIIQRGTRKEFPIYIANGYGYLKYNEKGGKIYLKCRMQKRVHCKATVVLNKAMNTFVVMREHSCETPAAIAPDQ